MPHSPIGSIWGKWDLHFHTPSSYDYENKGVTDEQIIEALLSEGICAVAITDHNLIDTARIKNLQKIGGNKITVFPGIELRCELGGKDWIHFIGIFPEDDDLDELWGSLSVKLNLTPKQLKELGHEKVYCDLKDSSKIIRDLGGLVTIHGHGKSNSIETIANFPEFKAQLKTDLLNDHIDFIELGNRDRQEDYKKIVFESINKELPLIMGSDNHNISKYKGSRHCWVKCDRTFKGLRMLLHEPTMRLSLEDVPPGHTRIEQSKDKYIESVEFEKIPQDFAGWFSGKTELNSGLVAIIGNKGTGKSALADTLGLLGSSANHEDFSFLNEDRFCHPRSGKAKHFNATLKWRSGVTVSKNLSDPVDLDKPETIKYLPQAHIETVCNEIVGVNEGIFEKELKSVIFSHVPNEKRLGKKSLDDLIAYRTQEKQKRIDSLISDLREITRQRATIEEALHPQNRQQIENKLEAKKQSLKALDEGKPQIPEGASVDQIDPNTQLELQENQKKLADLTKRKGEVDGGLKDSEENLESLKLLSEGFKNIVQDVKAGIENLRSQCEKHNIDVQKILTVNLDLSQIENQIKGLTTRISELREELGEKEKSGLLHDIETISASIALLRSKLDEPSRLYQQHLERVASWEEKRKEIVGGQDSPESISGLESQLSEIADFPTQAEALKDKQSAVAMQILSQKLELVDIYGEMYEPVQAFIENHQIAKGKFKLEFRVELAAHNLTDSFLQHISQNRKGSYFGTTEGKKRIESLASTVDWKTPDSISAFLDKVDYSLHHDERNNPVEQTQLTNQLAVGNTPEDVYNLIYGLEYLRPVYVLKWQGKDLSMLSPGERGTLLLAFYLLVDQSDVPLVIDQPEGNLDNHTVAKVLVDCIRVASQRRQVILVTHNPNLAVVCDADQVIHASMDNENDHSVAYVSGSLEDPEIATLITDVLEGTLWAFNIRDKKYSVTGH